MSARSLADARSGSVTYAGITFNSFTACRDGAIVKNYQRFGHFCGGQPCDINQLEVKVYVSAVRMGQVPVSYQLTVVHKHNGIGVKGVAAVGYISFSKAGVGNKDIVSGTFNMTLAGFNY